MVSCCSGAMSIIVLDRGIDHQINTFSSSLKHGICVHMVDSVCSDTILSGIETLPLLSRATRSQNEEDPLVTWRAKLIITELFVYMRWAIQIRQLEDTFARTQISRFAQNWLFNNLASHFNFPIEDAIEMLPVCIFSMLL